MLPALDTLSAELLSEICELIHETSPHTIFSLLRVNKTIHEAALPLVYREMTFDFTQNYSDGDDCKEEPCSRTLQQLDSLLKLPSEHPIWRGVRKITVHLAVIVWPGDPTREDPESDPESDSDPDSDSESKSDSNSNSNSNSDSVVEPLLPYFPSEQETNDRWNTFIVFPSQVTSLRRLLFDCAERVPLVVLRHLELKHPLCHLYARNWTRVSSDLNVWDSNNEALARSPCLRGIEAKFSHTPLSEEDLNQPAFDRIVALSPHLQELTMSFGATLGPQRKMNNCQVAEPLKKASVKKIIETLEVSGAPDCGWMEYAINHGTFSGLKNLEIAVEIARDRLRPLLTRDDLKLIRSEAPRLEHLAIDLNRSTTPAINEMTVTQAYEILSSFQNLLTITIHYNLGLHDADIWEYAEYFDNPLEYMFYSSLGRGPPRRASDVEAFYTKVDRRFVKEVWYAVKSERLEKVTLYIGEFSEGARDIGPWGQSVRKQISVLRNERDNMRDDVDALKIMVAFAQGRASLTG
ncbi:hypothetical protein PM082_024079 [Marasmius tenuissimus]|nr:hypothetical protein PM082_024079 [Marasmius tenuissimus]